MKPVVDILSLIIILTGHLFEIEKLHLYTSNFHSLLMLRIIEASKVRHCRAWINGNELILQFFDYYTLYYNLVYRKRMLRIVFIINIFNFCIFSDRLKNGLQSIQISGVFLHFMKSRDFDLIPILHSNVDQLIIYLLYNVHNILVVLSYTHYS